MLLFFAGFTGRYLPSSLLVCRCLGNRNPPKLFPQTPAVTWYQVPSFGDDPDPCAAIPCHAIQFSNLATGRACSLCSRFPSVPRWNPLERSLLNRSAPADCRPLYPGGRHHHISGHNSYLFLFINSAILFIRIPVVNPSQSTFLFVFRILKPTIYSSITTRLPLPQVTGPSRVTRPTRPNTSYQP